MAAPSSSSAEPGGFLPDTGLLSPTLSHVSASSITSASHVPGLPHPRKHALRSGSAKEDLVRRYLEERLRHISRRFVKKFGIPDPDDDVLGYKSMGELCHDVEALINVIWQSGTPNLQVPYLLNIASELVSWMDGFPPSPRASLAVLHKLDHCFTSLLTGEDCDSHEVLPGFERGLQRAGMTRTDMVRCRSVIELTRVAIVAVMSRGAPDPADEAYYAESVAAAEATENNSNNTDTDAETASTTTEIEKEKQELPDELDLDEEDLRLDVGSVYELTLVKLDEVLGGYGSHIGDVAMTDDI